MIEKKKMYDVLTYINRFSEDNGYAPTVREICAALHIKSTATGYSYINKLREAGLLAKADGKRRAVSVPSASTVRIPVLGTVTAGTPILAEENYEGYYSLPASEFKGDLFILNVKGDSMIEAGIYDGDKVIVQKKQTASNGDIVVALFDDGVKEGATVKRFFIRDGKYILHPENPALGDYVLNEVMILGKVVGLVRKY